MNILKICIFFLVIGQMAYAENITMNPKIALEKLVEGNKKFMNDEIQCPERISERRLALSSKQKPFAVILGCSDSRTPPEIIFDLGIGDLFVVRVAGNVIDDVGMDCIIYSVHVNGSCLVVVLGHENCGAVSAVMSHQAQGVPAVAALIEKATSGLKNSSTKEAILANIRYNVDKLKKADVFQDLIKQGKLEIIGGYYHFVTGEVEFLK
jgi:carbonic anhydrase